DCVVDYLWTIKLDHFKVANKLRQNNRETMPVYVFYLTMHQVARMLAGTPKRRYILLASLRALYFFRGENGI
ncbi:hypothetical protein N9W21_08935, partial [Shewanella sp.]|nr:hypothetical protein [Shewanella sp.]